MTRTDVNFEDLQEVERNLNEFFTEISDSELKNESVSNLSYSIWEFLNAETFN